MVSATTPNGSGGADTGRLPTFLIIGAPKAGTTALATHLGEHPEVFMSREKELHFFNRNLARGVEWYREQFRGSQGAPMVGEATPLYMYFDHALERMSELLPDVKLIAILRNPVDRAYSDYWWMAALNERRSFVEAIRQEMRDGGIGSRRPIGYLEVGRYLPRLQRVCELYQRSSLKVLLLDDLEKEPAATFDDVCRFLGIAEGIRPPSLGQKVNPAYRLRAPWVRREIMRFRLGRRAPRLAAFLEKVNRTPITYPPVDASVRTELTRWFAQENAALGEWLGRDLAAWSSASPARG